MTIYETLMQAGFKPAFNSPLVFSALEDIIESLESSKTQFAILPGSLVPEAKPEKYDVKTFNDNYMVFIYNPDKEKSK